MEDAGEACKLPGMCGLRADYILWIVTYRPSSQ